MEIGNQGKEREETCDDWVTDPSIIGSSSSPSLIQSFGDFRGDWQHVGFGLSICGGLVVQRPLVILSWWLVSV